MVGRYVISALALVTALSLRAGADPASTEQIVKTDTPAQTKPAPYVLAGDDVINVTVVNFSNLSTQVVVPPDGKISVPLLEPIDVTGKTTQEVAVVLAEKWRKYVVNPSVTVSLLQKRKDNVLVYGYVVKPGATDYKSPLRVLEALATVGGALPNGDLSRTTVTRRSGDKLTLDLSRPETKGGGALDVLLENGDTVYIPERRTQVNVVGEVNRPGSIDFRDDMTVAEAITAAGGVKESADLAASKLVHDGKESALDLEALFRRGDFTINKKIAAGDMIVVPELKNRVYVFGAVAKPGFYLFKPDDRVLDALNGCGGPVRDPALDKINLIRIDRTKNTAELTVVNIEKFLKKADAKANLPLQPGDVLFVPDKKHGFRLPDLFGMLSGINLIDTTYRIISGDRTYR